MSQSQKSRLREAILSADDLPRESVECPEWGETLLVRTLTGAERDIFENSVQSATRGKGLDLRGLKVKLVQLTLVTEDGEQLFESGDQLLLNGKSSRVIDRIFQVAQRLNGLSAEDADEMVENSDGDQNASSGIA